MEWRIVPLTLLSLAAGCPGLPRSAAEDESPGACYSALQAAEVGFERVPEARAAGIAWPIELSGPIAGVKVYGARKNAPTNYLDCRLALALVEWAPLLKRKGVVGLEHYSMYRAEATVDQSTKPSGHALGRAIDVAFFDLRDGRRLSVLGDWKNRTRGAAPCEADSMNDAEKLMRELVCEALDRGLFRTVVTPHYNDAHANHVHLEVGEPQASVWIR